MRLLTAIYRRLDLVQQKLWFRIAATVIALAGCGGYFGSIAARAYSLDSQKNALVAALAGQSIRNGDPHATSLQGTGTVTLDGRTYGSDAFRQFNWFDADGVVASPQRLAIALLDDQLPAWAPIWMVEDPGAALARAITITAWVVLVMWMGLTLPLLATILATAGPVIALYYAGKPGAMLAVAGMGVLTFTFVMLMRASMIALNRNNQMLAVAHTLLKEAARTRVALVFIVVLLAILPVIPMMLNPADPLRFRVQSFISWSMGLTFAATAFMTLVLSCATVAFEMRDRQIWQLMTKPLNRMSFLLGKWLGVMVVNLNILIVAGLSTFAFVQYMKTLPVAPGETGMLDRLAVIDEVLTARLEARPTYEQLTDEQVRQRVMQKVSADPNYGPDSSPPAAKLREFAQEVRNEFSAGQRSVPPQTRRIYKISGLEDAKKLNATLTMRYRFHILEDSEHDVYEAVFEFYDKNDQLITARPPAKYIPTMSHSFPLGTDLIQDDGTLRIGVANLYMPTMEQRGLVGVGALNFEEKDFEVLYKVGSFESNFIKALLTVWIKLAFLAAIGVCAATFLSFPVALLMAFTVFLAGLMSPFLSVALEWYVPPDASTVDWANIGIAVRWLFEKSTSLIAQGLLYVWGDFGAYQPRQLLIEGKFINWGMVLGAFLKLCLLWAGLCMIVGFLVLRKRQLAIYSGQG